MSSGTLILLLIRLLLVREMKHLFRRFRWLRRLWNFFTKYVSVFCVALEVSKGRRDFLTTSPDSASSRDL